MCPDPFDFAGGGLFSVVPAGPVPRLGITDRAAAGGPGAVGRFARASAPRAHMDDTSCDDFLKVNPDDALPPEEALSEQKDLDKALNGMYYTLTNTSFYGCNFLVRGEVGGDDIQPIGQTASRTENYYRFIHRINNSPEGLWSWLSL